MFCRPDRYVPLFGEYLYDLSKWRDAVPFIEQLQAMQDLIKEGKVRYIGVSNETSFGVMEFVHLAKTTAEMYSVPPNKETEGNTDRIINPWLKTRQRDKVCLSLSISNLKVIEDTV